MTMLELITLLFFCAPFLVGIWYLMQLYRQGMRTTTSAQTWAIVEKLQILTCALACYTMIVVPISAVVCHFLP